ncbi:MAG: type II toxin-antitoxin system HicB family antitoxin [Deltaproteobacteria bacterium]|nr:type II toxin-antitoxin system HicB family antitoxin [Deltaproteobacteria bacterium]MBI3390734.1 type II toxin-antitoxin system HicB family antitoxin [Deltaproteobacteria bacterium]
MASRRIAKSRRETVQTYAVHFHPQPGGGYTVTVPALPGCITEGDTLDEARAMVRDAIECYLAPSSRRTRASAPARRTEQLAVTRKAV